MTSASASSLCMAMVMAVNSAPLTDNLLANDLPLRSPRRGIPHLAIEPVLLTTTHERPGVIVLDGLDVGGWNESESARFSKPQRPLHVTVRPTSCVAWGRRSDEKREVRRAGSSRVGIQGTVLVLVRALALAMTTAMRRQWNGNGMTIAQSQSRFLGSTYCCSTNP